MTYNGWQFHCSHTEREHWLPIPCDQDAVIVYELKDGSRAGWCSKHRAPADLHARRLGWIEVEDVTEKVA